jgi:Protein of unknown function (DUF2911)
MSIGMRTLWGPGVMTSAARHLLFRVATTKQMPRRAAALLVMTLLILMVTFDAAAQTQAAQPKQPLSPRGQAQFTFADGKKIAVDYGRPYIRGRKIMGGLVPFSQVWRTGANAATSFITQAGLDFSGTRIPAGKYTLYTVPGETSWTIILNKQTGQWGTVYDPKQDLVRFNATPVHLPQAVDQFTISFERRGPNAGLMKLEWENTSVPLDFSEAAQ